MGWQKVDECLGHRMSNREHHIYQTDYINKSLTERQKKKSNEQSRTEENQKKQRHAHPQHTRSSSSSSCRRWKVAFVVCPRRSVPVCGRVCVWWGRGQRRFFFRVRVCTHTPSRRCCPTVCTWPAGVRRCWRIQNYFSRFHDVPLPLWKFLLNLNCDA